MNLLQFLQQQFHQALKGLIADPAPYVAMVKPAQDARHGDYQANCAMALAKELGRKPRDIAQEIVKQIPTGDWLMPPEIAGPGFINLRLRPEWLAQQLPIMARAILGEPRDERQSRGHRAAPRVSRQKLISA